MTTRTTTALLATLCAGLLLTGCSQEDIESAKETAAKVSGVIDEKAEALGVKDHVESLKEEAGKVVDNARDTVKEGLETLPDETKRAAADLLDAAGEKAKEVGESAAEKAQEIKDETAQKI